VVIVDLEDRQWTIGSVHFDNLLKCCEILDVFDIHLCKKKKKN
jgi:hypothetical protein